MVAVDGLSALFRASAGDAERLGDEDEGGVRRGPCPASGCPAYARRAKDPLAFLSSLRTGRVVDFSGGRNDPSGGSNQNPPPEKESPALCASCAHPASSHLDPRAFKRRAVKLANEKAVRDLAESSRLRRVAAARRRDRRARRGGVALTRTNLDAVTGAKRLGCAACGPARCPGFECAFLESDANDPEVMFHCARCGCGADAHPPCPQWEDARRRRRAEEERTRAEEEARRRKAREEEGVRRGRDDGYEERRQRVRDLRTLGLDELPAGAASEAAAARAYRRAAARWHPDKLPAGASEAEVERATEKFVAAKEAFGRLSSSSRCESR